MMRGKICLIKSLCTPCKALRTLWLNNEQANLFHLKFNSITNNHLM
jgi:hypothetical protein